MRQATIFDVEKINMDDPEILWCNSTRDMDAFAKGNNARDEDQNPYKARTNKWYSWNAGKNTRERK